MSAIRMMMGSRSGGAVDWESIAKGMVDQTTQFTPYIPSGVTKIRDYLYYGCNIGVVELPNTVDTIGYNSFSTSSITRFVAGSGLKYIGSKNSPAISGMNSSFATCTSLSEVVLNEGLLSIGYESFRGCSSLQAISIPSTVTYVGARCIYNTNQCVVTMQGTTPPDVNSTAFQHASIIYVPDSAYNDYLTAWASYTNFVGKVTKESERPTT